MIVKVISWSSKEEDSRSYVGIKTRKTCDEDELVRKDIATARWMKEFSLAKSGMSPFKFLLLVRLRAFCDRLSAHCKQFIVFRNRDSHLCQKQFPEPHDQFPEQNKKDATYIAGKDPGCNGGTARSSFSRGS